MNRQLLINCDDLGMHQTIDDAIFDILKQGFIRSCSIMPTGNNFHSAIEQFKALGGKRLGVHLALTGEYHRLPTVPVCRASEVPSLVDENGHLHREIAETMQKADLDEVRLELSRQIEVVAEQGLELTHLDGHCFFYEANEGGPELYQIAHKLAAEHRLPLRCNLSPRDGLTKGTEMLWDQHNDEEPRFAYYDKLLATMNVFPRELIIHPAKDLGAMGSFSASGARRVADYRYFMAERWLDILRSRDITIVSWADFAV
ncbi:MAG: ChbG/HpnK family deacetylase [Bdellovibrionota bacterium]